MKKSVKIKIQALSRRYGISEQAVLLRLADWFASQDELIQGLVIGDYSPEASRYVADLILSQAKGNTARPPNSEKRPTR